MSRIIYVDSENHCHPYDDGTMTAVETDFFDGKCDAFIEGYTYEVDDVGITIYPHMPYNILKAYQIQYEADQSEMEDMKTALNTMEVHVDG